MFANNNSIQTAGLSTSRQSSTNWRSTFNEIVERLRPPVELSLHSLDTINFYFDIDKAVSLKENPSFLLRSHAALGFHQQLQLCHKLHPVLKALNLQVNGDGPRTVGPVVYLDARLPECCGLAILKAHPSAVRQRSITIDEQDAFFKIVSVFDTTPLTNPRLYSKGKDVVPPDILLFAGGNFQTFEKVAPYALCLGLELILQDLKVPYSVSRGNYSNPNCTLDFDGTALRPAGSFLR